MVKALARDIVSSCKCLNSLFFDINKCAGAFDVAWKHGQDIVKLIGEKSTAKLKAAGDVYEFLYLICPHVTGHETAKSMSDRVRSSPRALEPYK